MPSGRVFTVTNQHVCGLAENGMVDVWAEGASRPTRSRVIIAAEDTDLCLVEGLPWASGLQMAERFNPSKRIYVLGHPLLKATTISSGFTIERNDFDIIESLDVEHCDGPGRRKEQLDGGLFVVEACIRKIDAWDSSAPIYPGSSGSPVMDKSGFVLGVIFAGQRETNHGLFIPLDILAKFISVY
jgi:S1-C subfamily serine protease